MSILIITPIVGINIEEKDIFENSYEYINYNDTAYEMQELTQMQTQKLYQQSAQQMVEEIVGEETEVEIIFSEENELQKIIIHKNVPEAKADIAAALGTFPSKIQMTE